MSRAGSGEPTLLALGERPPLRGAEVLEVRVRDSKLSERVAVALAADITAERLAVGEPFPSAEEIVDRFGVSRTVAREALQTLSASGLIRVHHGRRTEVTVPEEWNVFSSVVQRALWHGSRALPLMREQRQFLLLIEPFAAARVAERREPASIELISRLADQTVLLVEAEAPISQIVRCDYSFHCAIASASGNRVIGTAVRAVESMVDTLWATHYARYSHDELMLLAGHHVTIAGSIAAGDVEGASQAMNDHITVGTELVLRISGQVSRAEQLRD